MSLRRINAEVLGIPSVLREREDIRFTRVLRALRRGNLKEDEIEGLAEGNRIRLVSDRICRSGVLLNVPSVLPAMALTWKSLHGRVYRLQYVHGDSENRVYFYVCLDDLSLEALSLKPARIRGHREPEELVPLIASFSILLARLVNVDKVVFYTERVRLAMSLTRSILDVLRSWVSEVNGSGAKGDRENSVQPQ